MSPKQFLSVVLLLVCLVIAYRFGAKPPKAMQLTNTDYASFPLRVDSSTLLAKNKDTLLSFYNEIGNVPINIIQDATASPAPDNSVGLYHNAFVFQDGAALAKVLDKLLKKYPDSFEGSANHSVSLAFYFHDPEGNGIELYWDTPQDTWTKDSYGQVNMDTTYVDPQWFISRFSGPIRSDKIYLGHVHLKVSDISISRNFYTNILGFNVKKETPDALFLASGGYHHHIGTNTWVSKNSPPKPANTLGLVSYTLHAKPDMYTKIKSNLTSQNYPSVERGNVVEITDPWGIKVFIKKVE